MFEKLVNRVVKLHKVKPIRDDEQCLLLMQALNKFRELIEQNQAKDSSIASEKEILLNQVTKMLNRELVSIQGLDPSQSELIYLLFLYLASLDKKFVN